VQQLDSSFRWNDEQKEIAILMAVIFIEPVSAPTSSTLQNAVCAVRA
jgi:hypothetical protein